MGIGEQFELEKTGRIDAEPKAASVDPVVIRGWRFFECWECGEKWKSPSRDHGSPSGEDCPCGEFVSPVSSKPDESIPCDDMGNLIIPWKQTFIA